MAEQDEVRLTVPAMPEFLRLARVTATGLASRLSSHYSIPRGSCPVLAGPAAFGLPDRPARR